MAAIVLGAALVMLVGLSRPWGEATFAGNGVERVEQADDGERLTIEMSPNGRVQRERGSDAELVELYESDDNAAARTALRQAVPNGARDLVQVIGVLVALVAVVGMWRDLTQGTWILVTAAALACLVTVVLLRDDVLSALAVGAATMDLSAHETTATTWSGLAVAGAATASLVAGLAAGPRPARSVNPFRAVRRGRSTVTVTRPVPATTAPQAERFGP